MIVILSIINIIFVCIFLTILKDSFMNTLHKSIK